MSAMIDFLEGQSLLCIKDCKMGPYIALEKGKYYTLKRGDVKNYMLVVESNANFTFEYIKKYFDLSKIEKLKAFI